MFPPNLDGIFLLVTVASAVIIIYDSRDQQLLITLTEFSWLTEQVWNVFESVTWNILYLLTWREAVDMLVPWCT